MTIQTPVRHLQPTPNLLIQTTVTTQTNPLPSPDSELSDASDASDLATVYPDETLADRLAALKDMIPPSSRRRISGAVSSISAWGWSAGSFTGKALWVVSTSAMLIGLPFALAVAEDQAYAEQEREIMQQRAQGEVS